MLLHPVVFSVRTCVHVSERQIEPLGDWVKGNNLSQGFDIMSDEKMANCQLVFQSFANQVNKLIFRSLL